MHNLLFFKAIAHQKLNQQAEATETVKRLYSLLYSLNEPDKDNEYFPILQRIFGDNFNITFNNKK
jgi:hypothetical protein